MKPINTIDDVIRELEYIVQYAIDHNSTTGYFAALYLKVTKKVKQGIAEGFFEDGPRMEKLDVIFAKRYIEAYHQFRNGKTPSMAWTRAFALTDTFWPIVLQHLLVGMNAHINLDLGIAAAEVQRGKPMDDLHTDFNRINQILSSLVTDVERDLSSIWPFLAKLLRWTRHFDNFLIDFSMELARDGAWKFAVALADTTEKQQLKFIATRDEKVAKKAEIITQPGWIVRLLFAIIRLGEKGSVAQKIQDLNS